MNTMKKTLFFTDYETKLKNFPSVNFPSLEECSNRRNFMQGQFEKYGIKNATCFITERYATLKEKVHFHSSVGITEEGQPGIVHSFLTLLKNWYDNTNEEYAIFCDDDIDFSTIEHWNFTWDEFIEGLPSDWECVQLIALYEIDITADNKVMRYGREVDQSLKLSERVWDDWGSTFMVKREFAKKILDSHWISPTSINLDVQDCGMFLFPIIEHVLFRGKGKVYHFPLFVENVNFDSIWSHSHSIAHNWARKTFENLWKEHAKNPVPLSSLLGSKPAFSKYASVNYTSLEESVDRRNFMDAQLNKYGVSKKNHILAKRHSEHKDEFKYRGKYLHTMDDGGIGAVITHLRLIKQWYETTSEDYGIFCEDDIDFSVSENWNFTVDEFIDSLPLDWECVQLIRIHNFSQGRFKEPILFRERSWDDWGSTYLLKRSYAKKILDHYCHNDEFVIDVPGDLTPMVENVLYTGLGKVYNCPLLVENVHIPTTFIKEFDKAGFKGYDISRKIKGDHHESSVYVKNLWETDSKNISLDELIPVDYQKGFDWATLHPEYAEMFRAENFEQHTYERAYSIKPGDVVMDFGANVGAFTCSILPKKPKHVYCIEPSDTLVHVIKKNVRGAKNVTIINAAVSDVDARSRKVKKEEGVFLYENSTDVYDSLTFQTIIAENNIDKVDFLKFDCEGGEYNIFTEENFLFIRNNVKHAGGEWHITHHPNALERFKKFRDLYLKSAVSFTAYDRYGYDVTKDIFDEDYLERFDAWHQNTFLGQFMIYINNV
jgi:FkbM family methyltransferase